MKPVDALRLPGARLTNDQRTSIAKAIEILESLYESGMKRSGLSVDMRCGDFVVLYELERHCKSEGWLTQVFPDWNPPHISGAAPTLKGFKMILTPPQSAYEEVDAEARS